jgi:hypothetical protein
VSAGSGSPPKARIRRTVGVPTGASTSRAACHRGRRP